MGRDGTGSEKERVRRWAQIQVRGNDAATLRQEVNYCTRRVNYDIVPYMYETLPDRDETPHWTNGRCIGWYGMDERARALM